MCQVLEYRMSKIWLYHIFISIPIIPLLWSSRCWSWLVYQVGFKTQSLYDIFMCFQGNVMGLLVCLMFIPVQIQTMIWKERTPGRRQSGGVRKVLMVVGGGYCGCSVVSIESTRSCHVIPALHCTTYSHHKHPNTQSVSVSTDINPSQNRTVRRSSLIRTTDKSEGFK